MREVTANVNSNCYVRRIKIFHFFKWYMVIDNIKEFFRGIKVIYQRARYGLSYRDVWNLEAYVADVLANGCATLVNIGSGYPYGTTYEDWHNELCRFVKIARDYVDEPWYLNNTYSTHSYEIGEENYKEFMKFINKYYRSLWD